MAFPINEYPYTDLHEMNMDWVLRQIKETVARMDNFIQLNAIKYADPLAWDITKSYEENTVVFDDVIKIAYLSVKPVPAGVMITDTDYWTAILDLAPFYDSIGDLSQLTTTNKDNLVDAINEINSHPNRRFIILSDSYGDHVNTNGLNFYEQAMSDLGYIKNVDWYDVHLGGSGFIRPAPRNFTDLLMVNDGNISNHNTITDIVVCSGANDQMTPADILPNIQIFCDYCKLHYPNAKISIGCFTRAWEPPIIDKIRDTFMEYEKCIDFGAHYIANSQYVMMRLTDFKSDNVHPTTSGVDKLTKYFKAWVVNGYFDVDEVATNTFASGTKGTLTVDNAEQRQHNADVYITAINAGAFLEFNFNTSQSIAVGEAIITEVLRMVDGFLMPDGINNLIIAGRLCTSGTPVSFTDVAMYMATVQMGMIFDLGFVTYRTTSMTYSTGTRFSGPSQSFMPI